MVPLAMPYAFAEPMKNFCKDVFGFSDDELFGPSEARERPSSVFTRPNGTPLTPRFALQTLGTEWGRNCDPDVWAKACIRKILSERDLFDETEKHHVITDLRFVNEARLVREAGGKVIRVFRPQSVPAAALSGHASERDVFSPEMDPLIDFTIYNVAGLDELRLAVEEAITTLSKEG